MARSGSGKPSARCGRLLASNAAGVSHPGKNGAQRPSSSVAIKPDMLIRPVGISILIVRGSAARKNPSMPRISPAILSAPERSSSGSSGLWAGPGLTAARAPIGTVPLHKVEIRAARRSLLSQFGHISPISRSPFCRRTRSGPGVIDLPGPTRTVQRAGAHRARLPVHARPVRCNSGRLGSQCPPKWRAASRYAGFRRSR
jgi:hypothetical protein